MCCMEVKQALLFPALGLSGDDTWFPPGHHNKELFRMWPARYFSPSLAERIKRRITVVLVRERNCFSPPSSLSSASNLSEIRNSGITGVSSGEDGSLPSPCSSALCTALLGALSGLQHSEHWHYNYTISFKRKLFQIWMGFHVKNFLPCPLDNSGSYRKTYIQSFYIRSIFLFH